LVNNRIIAQWLVESHCTYCRTCLRQIVARHFIQLTRFKLLEPWFRVRQFARRYKISVMLIFKYPWSIVIVA